MRGGGSPLPDLKNTIYIFSFDGRKRCTSCPKEGEGGEVIRAMPERKHLFLGKGSKKKKYGLLPNPGGRCPLMKAVKNMYSLQIAELTPVYCSPVEYVQHICCATCYEFAIYWIFMTLLDELMIREETPSMDLLYQVKINTEATSAEHPQNPTRWISRTPWEVPPRWKATRWCSHRRGAGCTSFGQR